MESGGIAESSCTELARGIFEARMAFTQGEEPEIHAPALEDFEAFRLALAKSGRFPQECDDLEP